MTTPPESAPGSLKNITVVIAIVIAAWAISRCQSSPPAAEPTPSPSENAQAQAPSAPLAAYTDKDKVEWMGLVRDEKAVPSARLHRARAVIQYFPDSAEANEAKGSLEKLQAAVDEAIKNPPGAWSYASSEDPMTSKTIKTASLDSEQPFVLDFPYQGPQHASLLLRKHPKWGKNVIFRIERGQLTCDVYECPLLVRFGSGRPVTYRAGRADDGSSEVAFIEEYNDFVRRMQAVDTVRIQFSVYQGGNIVQEFNVRGFDPERM